MGTKVYGPYRDLDGVLNVRSFYDYTASSTNTSYSLTIYAGYEVVNKSIGPLPASSGGTFSLAGTGQTTKSVTASWPATNKGASASKTLISSFTWTWNKGTSAATKTVSATGPVGRTTSVASANFTVPAKPSYTVSYNANGGSGAPGNQTKWYGTNLTLSSTKPTRTGYSFNGWNTNSSGTGTNYASGGTYTGNAALTLYAKWKANTYTVSYNANGGSGAPGNQTKTYGVNLTLSSTVPTRTGYTFNGWNTNSSGTGTNYAKGATYTGNAALTLYAKWTANTYTVTYNSNAPSGRTASGSTANSTHTYNAAKNLTTNGYSVPDYVFTGWATSATGTVAYTNGQSVKNLATSGTKTLYAVWRYAYTKAAIDLPTAVRYNGTVPDDTGTDARAFVAVTPAQVENASFQKSYIETRVYAQARANGATTWPAITSETTGYEIVDATTGKKTVEFILSPPSGESEFGTDTQYDVRIVAIAWVNDSNKTENTRGTFISKANFVLDVNADGTAIGILTAVGDNASGLYIGKELHLELDTISGGDPLYTAITALGWQNDVME